MKLDFVPVRFETLPEPPEILRELRDVPRPSMILFNGKVRVFEDAMVPEGQMIVKESSCA